MRVSATLCGRRLLGRVITCTRTVRGHSQSHQSLDESESEWAGALTVDSSPGGVQVKETAGYCWQLVTPRVCLVPGLWSPLGWLARQTSNIVDSQISIVKPDGARAEPEHPGRPACGQRRKRRWMNPVGLSASSPSEHNNTGVRHATYDAPHPQPEFIAP
ncbi:hypothetical protein BV22DRAFT_1041687 [Leucogyrophana mollusca]|uniref:Uncharacterized protein n=1 Tax=Leucogyrophana mollusca TaxID=85980 RepID=A0ACB8B127_9AGAM|nr:hypothetical protein BV22DRAFT_1041687 [Leucogyrophana mollusca]